MDSKAEEAKGDAVRPKTKIIKEISELMADLNLDKGRTIVAENSAPGTVGRPEKVQTNVFGVSLKEEQTVYIHDVMIFADVAPNKQLLLTKKGKDDRIVSDRKEKCTFLLKSAYRLHNKFFGDPFALYYDGQSLLFSVNNLFAEEENKVKRIVVPGTELKEIFPEIGMLDFIVEIKMTSKESLPLTHNGLIHNTARKDLSENDYSISQFLEIAINQYAIMNPQRHFVFESGKTYMRKPWDEGFTDKDCLLVGDDKRLMVGTQKSIRQIEGPSGRGNNNVSLTIDAKKAAFHEGGKSVAVKIMEMFNDRDGRFAMDDRKLERVNQVLKGVIAATNHLKPEKKKEFPIAAIVKQNANTFKFEHEGKMTSVAEYFAVKHGALKFPHAPLVQVRERGQVNFYPPECLTVPEGQRVTVPQTTPEQSQQTTRNCAVLPAIRQANIMKGITSLELLSDDNKYIKNAGIKIHKAPLMVPSRMLPAPAIVYNGARPSQAGDGKWRSSGGFMTPGKIELWAIYGISTDGRDMDHGLLTNFAERFVGSCQKKGLKMPPPADLKVIPEREVKEHIETATQFNCTMIFFITSDNIKTVHKNMKLWERQFQITTQDMKLSNAKAVVQQNKFLTLDNVILKTNIKLGGLNHSLIVAGGPDAQRWLKKGRLFLAMSISHAPVGQALPNGAPLPSVVGYAGNWKQNNLEFIGDYAYQEFRREETLTVMSKIIDHVVSSFKENHSGKVFNEIVIYRAGVGEGSYKTILQHEVPMLRNYLKQSGAPDVKITFIVVQKDHNVRIMLPNIDPAARPTQQNIQPGMVVDSQLVHPTLKEFFLNSHTTLQGSARTPRYTALVDDCNMSMDELEGATHALSYCHQIVTLTTSTPTPLYVAQRFSERGRDVLGAYIATGGHVASSDSSSSTDASKFTDVLGLRKSRLVDKRINA